MDLFHSRDHRTKYWIFELDAIGMLLTDYAFDACPFERMVGLIVLIISTNSSFLATSNATPETAKNFAIDLFILSACFFSSYFRIIVFDMIFTPFPCSANRLIFTLAYSLHKKYSSRQSKCRLCHPLPHVPSQIHVLDS